MAIALGVLYLAGPAIIAIAIALPHPETFDVAGLWLIVLTAPLIAAGLIVLAGRIPVWGLQLIVALGTVYITATVYLTHEPNSFFTAFYFWAGLYASACFGLRWGAVHLAWIGATYAWVLTEVPYDSPVASWLVTVGTIGISGVLAALMVQRLRRIASESQIRARNMAAVNAVAHELARHADPDAAAPAICQAALDVAGARAAMLWRPAPDGTGLVAVAATQRELRDRKLPFVGRPAGALRAYSTGEPFFVANASGNPNLDETIVGLTETRSCLFQPVLREDITEGVLAVHWDRHVESVDADVAQAVGVLAAEASIAIARSELLIRLEKAARTDDLTGLLNRRAWDEELLREMARSTRLDTALCVAILDLDHFKQYNDEHGHQAGDRFLKEAAASWRELVRATDVLARYGGEEFSLALPHCDPDHAQELLERLRLATPEGETCSAGIAYWDGDESADELIGRADVALYDAKRNGRNRVIAALRD